MTVLEARSFGPVEQPIEAPKTLSQTRLGRFDNCPRAFYLDALYHGGAGSHAMDRGTALHETLERCVRMMLESGESQMPGEVARDVAEAVMTERTDLVIPEREQDVVRHSAWTWAECTTLDLSAVVGVEVPMTLELGNWTLTARVDRVEVHPGFCLIVDYKSGLDFPGREAVQRGWQGRFYALMVAEGRVEGEPLPLAAGINDFNYSEQYPRLRPDTETGAVRQRLAAWTRAELGEFKQTLLSHTEKIEAAIEDGLWEPRQGSWCARCPAPRECPIPAELREVRKIESLAEAQEAFEAWLALDREKAAAQRHLREWIKADNGPIYVGDLAFDAAFSESRSVKDWDLLELAIARSTQYGEVFEAEAHIERRQSVKYAKRRQTEKEREANGLDV